LESRRAIIDFVGDFDMGRQSSIYKAQSPDMEVFTTLLLGKNPRTRRQRGSGSPAGSIVREILGDHIHEILAKIMMLFQELLQRRLGLDAGHMIDFGLRPIVDHLLKSFIAFILWIFMPEKRSHLGEDGQPLTLNSRTQFSTAPRDLRVLR
jgi:hypothetical protein